MILSLIVAMDRNRIIGKDNTMPWYLPSDLRFFKRVTLGKPVIMGRKTYQSIGKPLPGRLNIIVSRDNTFQASGCTVVHSLQDALQVASSAAEVMLGGGATLYEQMLPQAQRIYLTEVDANIEGDARFPQFDEQQWQTVWYQTQPVDQKHQYSYKRRLLIKDLP